MYSEFQKQFFCLIFQILFIDLSLKSLNSINLIWKCAMQSHRGNASILCHIICTIQVLFCSQNAVQNFTTLHSCHIFWGKKNLPRISAKNASILNMLLLVLTLTFERWQSFMKLAQNSLNPFTLQYVTGRITHKPLTITAINLFKTLKRLLKKLHTFICKLLTCTIYV